MFGEIFAFLFFVIVAGPFVQFIFSKNKPYALKDYYVMWYGPVVRKIKRWLRVQ
jgi:hypothetical protein